MNPAAAALILTLSCQQPALNFRDFYQQPYRDQEPAAGWFGQRLDTLQNVVIRMANAQADWLEYRVARFEKCGAAK